MPSIDDENWDIEGVDILLISTELEYTHAYNEHLDQMLNSSTPPAPMIDGCYYFRENQRSWTVVTTSYIDEDSLVVLRQLVSDEHLTHLVTAGTWVLSPGENWSLNATTRGDGDPLLNLSFSENSDLYVDGEILNPKERRWENRSGVLDEGEWGTEQHLQYIPSHNIEIIHETGMYCIPHV